MLSILVRYRWRVGKRRRSWLVGLSTGVDRRRSLIVARGTIWGLGVTRKDRAGKETVDSVTTDGASRSQEATTMDGEIREVRVAIMDGASRSRGEEMDGDSRSREEEMAGVKALTTDGASHSQEATTTDGVVVGDSFMTDKSFLYIGAVV